MVNTPNENIDFLLLFELTLEQPRHPFRYVLDGGGGERMLLSAKLRLESAEQAKLLRSWERQRFRELVWGQGDWSKKDPVSPLLTEIHLIDQDEKFIKRKLQTRMTNSTDRKVQLNMMLYTPMERPFGERGDYWNASISLASKPIGEALQLPLEEELMSNEVTIKTVAVPLAIATFQERVRSLLSGTGRVRIERILGEPFEIYNYESLPTSKSMRRFIEKYRATLYVYRDDEGDKVTLVFDQDRRYAPRLQWS